MKSTPLDLPRAVGDDNVLPVRHAAALMVIYGHSYDLTRPLPGSMDLVKYFMPGFKAGSLAVYIFFALSGYLVMLSTINHPGSWRYLRNRVLRIYPGYLLLLLISVAVLGPIFSTLSLRQYIADPGTWRFVSENLIPIKLAWGLPGVFAANPFPNVVNGSIWSLGLEFRWYCYIGFLLVLGVSGRRWAFSLVAAAFLTYAGWEWWIGRPDPLYFRSLSMVFVATALIAHWRARIGISHAVLLGSVLVCALLRNSTWFGAAATATIVYMVFWIMFAVPSMAWPIKLDYSYGLFLYGFPVQQALVALWPQITPMRLFFSASLLAFCFAALSWHFVEAPALRLKSHRLIAGKTRQASA